MVDYTRINARLTLRFPDDYILHKVTHPAFHNTLYSPAAEFNQLTLTVCQDLIRKFELPNY